MFDFHTSSSQAALGAVLSTCMCLHVSTSGTWVHSAGGMGCDKAGEILLCFSVFSVRTLLSYLWKIDPYSLRRDLHQILILPICSM